MTTNLSSSINEQKFVFLDLETSGKYPIDSEICEMAAIKWENGKFTDTFSSLIKTRQPMTQTVINIHKITNEMLEEAPSIEHKISEFRDFIGDGICVAHHSPFDAGFLAYEFEKNKIELPTAPILCTSLLARERVIGVENHRLQTLVKYFHINGGVAHRALDDAKACADVFFNCIKGFELEVSLEDVIDAQKYNLLWSNFSMDSLRKKKHLENLISAVEHKKQVNMSYSGGSKPGEFRVVKPISVVRNPEGDFLVADDLKSKKLKRYFVEKVTDCKIIQT